MKNNYSNDNDNMNGLQEHYQNLSIVSPAMEVFDASHRNPNINTLHTNASFLSDKIGVSEKK